MIGIIAAQLSAKGFTDEQLQVGPLSPAVNIEGNIVFTCHRQNIKTVWQAMCKLSFPNAHCLGETKYNVVGWWSSGDASSRRGSRVICFRSSSSHRARPLFLSTVNI